MAAATDQLSIAVIGGGISGLYAAAKLVESDHHVMLFEATERLGGRILSIKSPDTLAPLELGAMRFRRQHRRLIALLRTLFNKFEGTTIDEFDEVRPFEAETRLYLRGELSSDKDRTYNSRFKVYPHERSLQPGGLIRCAFDKLFSLNALVRAEFKVFLNTKSEADLTSFHDKYQTLFKYDALIEEVQNLNPSLAPASTQLYKVGFWNLMALLLSSEAYHLAHDAIGYDSLLNNWNAAEAIPYFINDYIDDRYITLRGGMSRLISELENKLRTKIEMRRNHSLRSIKLDARGRRSPLPCISLQFDNGAAFRCDRVVLAMPRGPLEDLDVSGSSEWSAFRRVSASVRGEPAFKCFLVYNSPWWTQSKWTDRPWEQDKCYRICTDLPLRQVYLFPPEWLETTHGDSSNVALVMASYSDAHYTNFWHPLLNPTTDSDEDARHGFTPRTKFKTDAEYRRLMPYLASDRMVQHLVGQLLKIFDCYNELGELDPEKDHLSASIKSPVYAFYKDWSPERGEIGWHFWQVNHRREHVETAIDRLAEYDGICICGEAYSDNQGWIEGALETTERVLNKARLIVGGTGFVDEVS